MRRVHLFEFNDQPWLPAPLRRLATDYLEAILRATDMYAPAAAPIAAALGDSGARRVVDLASGGGGPWRRLLPRIARELGDAPEIVLTDLYPDRGAFASAAADLGGKLGYIDEPVDAVRVPRELRGMRTLFDGFHHLRPQQARKVLADAVAAGQPIGVFEAAERTATSIASLVVTVPLSVLAVTPLVRPRRWWRFLLTYAIPLAPLLITWDGLVSCLRWYSPDELRALIADVDPDGAYEWRFGRGRRLGRGVSWMVGLPRRPRAPTLH